MKSVFAKNEKEIEEILENFKDELPILRTSFEYRKSMSEKFFAHGKVLIIENDEVPIAFSAFYANDLMSKNAYISFIAVQKKYSKCGIGTNLMAKVCECSKQYGMEKIRLEVYNDNLPAIGFYKKNGFEIEGGRTEKGFYMVKIL